MKPLPQDVFICKISNSSEHRDLVDDLGLDAGEDNRRVEEILLREKLNRQEVDELIQIFIEYQTSPWKKACHTPNALREWVIQNLQDVMRLGPECAFRATAQTKALTADIRTRILTSRIWYDPADPEDNPSKLEPEEFWKSILTVEVRNALPASDKKTQRAARDEILQELMSLQTNKGT